MTLFRFLVTLLVTLNNSLWSKAPSFTNIGRAIEAKLQTATSSGEVYSIISVQRLEERMVPKFFWLLFLLAASSPSRHLGWEVRVRVRARAGAGHRFPLTRFHQPTISIWMCLHCSQCNYCIHCGQCSHCIHCSQWKTTASTASNAGAAVCLRDFNLTPNPGLHGTDL